MQELRATYAGLCPGCGLEVLAPGPESGQPPSITIGDTAYSLPTYARFPVVRHWPVHRVAFSGQDGTAYTVDETGGLVRLGRVFGRMAAGFLLDGRAWWQDGLTTYRIETDPQSYAIPYGPGSTGGCWGDPALARSWVGADDASPVVRGGLRIFNPAFSIDGQWIVGNHPTLPRHLAYSEADGVLYDAGPSLGTPMYPTVVLRGGEPVLVRSYPSGLLPRAAWTPWAASAPAPVPPVPVPPAAAPRGLPAFPRKMWTSSFYGYSEKYGDTDDHIGTAITVVEDETDPAACQKTLARVAALGRPVIVGHGPTVWPASVVGMVVGRFASGATIDALGEAVRSARAQPPDLPVYAYLDRSGWPTSRPAWADQAVIPEIQVYRLKSESRATAEQRIRADFEAVAAWSEYTAACFRFDDYNRANGDDQVVLADLPFYEQLIRTYRVVLVHFFADRRPGGMAEYPALRDAARQFCDAVPARPGRFDYWESPAHGKKARLLNKLSQDVDLVQLSASDRAALLPLVKAHL